MATVRNKHCCERARLWIANIGCPFVYIPYERKYGITVPKWYLRRDETAFIYPLDFCPACGTKFPPELGYKRYEVLTKEYGILDNFEDEQQSIPKEFKTEEWWRKRGL